jgi:hypothetical protein
MNVIVVARSMVLFFVDVDDRFGLPLVEAAAGPLGRLSEVVRRSEFRVLLDHEGSERSGVVVLRGARDSTIGSRGTLRRGRGALNRQRRGCGRGGLGFTEEAGHEIARFAGSLFLLAVLLLLGRLSLILLLLLIHKCQRRCLHNSHMKPTFTAFSGLGGLPRLLGEGSVICDITVKHRTDNVTVSDEPHQQHFRLGPVSPSSVHASSQRLIQMQLEQRLTWPDPSQTDGLVHDG